MLGTPLNRSAVALCRAGKRSQAPLDLEPSCHLNVCVYEAQALIERSGWVLFQHVQSAIFGAFRSAPLEQFLYQPATDACLSVVGKYVNDADVHGSLGLEGAFQSNDPRHGMAEALTRGILGHQILGGLKLKVVSNPCGNFLPG